MAVPLQRLWPLTGFPRHQPRIFPPATGQRIDTSYCSLTGYCADERIYLHTQILPTDKGSAAALLPFVARAPITSRQGDSYPITTPTSFKPLWIASCFIFICTSLRKKEHSRVTILIPARPCYESRALSGVVHQRIGLDGLGSLP